MPLTPISEITKDLILAEIRQALRYGVDQAALTRFAASIDWSESITAPSAEAVKIMGNLEGWTTELAEGDLLPREFVGRLLSLFPENERKRLIVFGSPWETKEYSFTTWEPQSEGVGPQPRSAAAPPRLLALP